MFDWVLNTLLGVVYETSTTRSQRMRMKITFFLLLKFKRRNVNPFLASVSILHPLGTTENLRLYK